MKGQLTPRQREVLTLRANGMTNIDVARELHMREDSVRAAISRACRRMGARHVTQAVAIALALDEIGIHQITIPLTTGERSTLTPQGAHP